MRKFHSNLLKAHEFEKMKAENTAFELASARAEQILSEATQAAENIRKQAHLQGQQQGYQELADNIMQVRNHINEVYKNNQQTIVDLAISLAEKIIHRELSHQAGIPDKVLEESILTLQRANFIRIHVNPENKVELEQCLPMIKQSLGFEGELSIAEDNTISTGGCIFESNIGDLDARIKTRLTSLKRALNESK